MASLFSTASDWRRPFEIVSFIRFLLIILYFFVEEPTLGSSDPELKELIKEGYDYDYNIEFNHIFDIISKRNNILLFVQAFFMNLSTGTLIFLPLLYQSKILNQGYNKNTATIAASFLYAIFQLGGLTSAWFGHLGDKLQRKSYKGRPLITSFFVFITMPLYIAMFLIPMKNFYLQSTASPTDILFGLVAQIFTNPWITAMFILSFFASATQSSNTPNWLALITETNLPEHRPTAFSVANLANGIGRSLGSAGVGTGLLFISLYSKAPTSYVITLVLFQFFLLPSAFCYLRMTKTIKNDITEIKSTLIKRAKLVK
jgi:predicted MFS family arabinose efflux permease